MADLWVQGKAVTTRVDYSQVPQNETLAVNCGGHGQRARAGLLLRRRTGPDASPSTASGIRAGRPSCWTARTAARCAKLPLRREEGRWRGRGAGAAGEGYILLRFEDTPLRAAAKWVTLATLGPVIVTVVILRIRRRKMLDKTRT